MDIDEILKNHQNKVLLHIRRLVPEADTEDVMQEALIGAWQNYSRFDGRGSFECWLERITRNKIADYYRKRSGTIVADDIEDWPIPAKSVYDDFEVYDLLQKLPETYRNVLWKHYVEDMTYPEIEAEEGQSRAALRSRSRRAIEYIRTNDLVER